MSTILRIVNFFECLNVFSFTIQLQHTNLSIFSSPFSCNTNIPQSFLISVQIQPTSLSISFYLFSCTSQSVSLRSFSSNTKSSQSVYLLFCYVLPTTLSHNSLNLFRPELLSCNSQIIKSFQLDSAATHKSINIFLFSSVATHKSPPQISQSFDFSLYSCNPQNSQSFLFVQLQPTLNLSPFSLLFRCNPTSLSIYFSQKSLDISSY